MLIPASLQSLKFYNQQLDCPIDFSELALLFNEDSLSDLFKADFKRWEHNLRDKWRARGQTIRHTEDYSYWWPEGLSASFGLTDEQLCMMLFVAEQHRDSINQMAQYLGALEWLKCNALPWVNFKPLQINSRSKQGRLASLALKELGLGKADFDLYTSKFIYVKSVAHLGELLATGPVQKEDFEQIKLTEKLAEKFLEYAPVSIDSMLVEDEWEKPAKQKDLFGMLYALLEDSCTNILSLKVTKDFIKYIGLNSYQTELTSTSIAFSFGHALRYLKENGMEAYAIKGCLYLLLEVGALSIYKKSFTYEYASCKFATITLNPWQPILDVLEKYTGRASTSGAVLFDLNTAVQGGGTKQWRENWFETWLETTDLPSSWRGIACQMMKEKVKQLSS